MEEKDPNKLDRSQPFGIVFGDPHRGFEQGGRDFDHSGKLYVKPEERTSPEKRDEIPKETLKLRTDKLREAFEKRQAE